MFIKLVYLYIIGFQDIYEVFEPHLTMKHEFSKFYWFYWFIGFNQQKKKKQNYNNETKTTKEQYHHSPCRWRCHPPCQESLSEPSLLDGQTLASSPTSSLLNIRSQDFWKGLHQLDFSLWCQSVQATNTLQTCLTRPTKWQNIHGSLSNYTVCNCPCLEEAILILSLFP